MGSRELVFVKEFVIGIHGMKEGNIHEIINCRQDNYVQFRANIGSYIKWLKQAVKSPEHYKRLARNQWQSTKKRGDRRPEHLKKNRIKLGEL